MNTTSKVSTIDEVHVMFRGAAGGPVRTAVSRGKSHDDAVAATRRELSSQGFYEIAVISVKDVVFEVR